MSAVSRALAALALAGCAHTAEPPADQPTAADAILIVRSNLPDAEIVIDGTVIASVKRQSARGMAIEPGHHHLELRRDEYLTAYADLKLARAEHRTIQLDLMPILP